MVDVQVDLSFVQHPFDDLAMKDRIVARVNPLVQEPQAEVEMTGWSLVVRGRVGVYLC